MNDKKRILGWCDMVEDAVTKGGLKGKCDEVLQDDSRSESSYTVKRRRKMPSRRRQPR